MTSRKGGPWLANQALPYGRATASFVNSMPLPQRGRNVYSLVSKIFAKPQRGDIRAADVAPIGAWRFFVHKAINISPLWGCHHKIRQHQKSFISSGSLLDKFSERLL